MFNKLFKHIISFIPSRTVVVEKAVDKIPVHIVNSVRGLMLRSPITDWEEGYNHGVEDALEKIEGK